MRIAIFGSGGVGGYFGARLARRLPAPLLRRSVIAFGAAATAVFFWRAWA